MFWCYGNPGVSLGLLWAAWGLNSDVIQGQAWSLFKTWNAYLRNRPKELARIGVTFCHGFAGLAEISRFFFALTAEPYAEDCWQYWVTHLRTKNKLAGALQGGLLEGTLGVRATIACAHQRDSHNPWSRLFGTSLGAPALADESPRLAE